MPFDRGFCLFRDYNRSCSFPTSYQQNQAVVEAGVLLWSSLSKQGDIIDFTTIDRQRHRLTESKVRSSSYPDRDGSR